MKFIKAKYNGFNHKILIGKDGKVFDTFAPFTNPMSKKVIKSIEKTLK